MSSTKVIKTSNAPDPVGPYNQAIKAGNFIYCSGQIAIDPVSNKINCLGNIEKETTQVLKNLFNSSALKNRLIFISSSSRQGIVSSFKAIFFSTSMSLFLII